MTSLHTETLPIRTECDRPQAEAGDRITPASETSHGRGQPRKATKAGADLAAFETLVNGWNELNRPELPSSDRGGMLESRASDDQQADPGLPADSVAPNLLHLITRDARVISHRIMETQRQLKSLEMDLDRARASERATAISLTRDLVRRYALRPEELAFGDAKEGEGSLGASPQEDGPNYGAEPKSGCFRGPSGEVWLGRGRHPAWLKRALDCGGQLSDYWQSGSAECLAPRAPDRQEMEHD